MKIAEDGTTSVTDEGLTTRAFALNLEFPEQWRTLVKAIALEAKLRKFAPPKITRGRARRVLIHVATIWRTIMDREIQYSGTLANLANKLHGLTGKTITDEQIHELRKLAVSENDYITRDLCDLAMSPYAAYYIRGIKEVVTTDMARVRCAGILNARNGAKP